MKTFGINIPDTEINDLLYTGTHVITGTGTLSVTIPIGSVLSSIPSGLKDFESFVLSADYFAINREVYHGYVGTAAIAAKSLRKMGIVGRYNFHQAFHPAGYYSPPFGETPTIETIDGAIIPKPTAGGPCPYNAKEDFELFGMITTQNKVNSFTINMGFMPIFEPSEECPPEIPPLFFYEPVSMNISAGTMKHIGLAGGIGGNFYNDNPIPASIDTKNILHSKASPWDLIKVPVYQGYIYYYRINANKQAIPIVPSKPNHDKLNNILCKARMLETSTAPGVGFVGIQLGAADGYAAAMNDQYNFGGYDAWNMWHFYFRYNHWNYPFQGSHEDAPRLVAKGKFETQVAEEHWWEDRQCANTNDFLPWTTSTTIKACPSDYFDVPYYSAIRRFGFYGTRFQNTCKKIDFSQTGQYGEIVADYPDQSAETVPTGTLFVEGDDDIMDLIDPGAPAASVYNTQYDNILAIANQEQKFADFYAGNKAFFLWGNYTGMVVDAQIKPLVDNQQFSFLFSQLKKDFDRIFWNIHNFVSGGYNAFVMVSSFKEYRYPIVSTRSSVENDFALSSDYWNSFDREARMTLTGAGLPAYDYAIEKYSKYIYDFANGGANHKWYDDFIKEKEKRIRTRHFENKVHGFPIDLFPTNQMTLSSEEAWKNMGFDTEAGHVFEIPRLSVRNNTRDWSDRFSVKPPSLGGRPAGLAFNSGWLRSNFGDFFVRDILPETERRYFYGAYSHSGEVLALKNESRPGGNATRPFYAGFLNNIKCGTDLPASTQEIAEITGVVSGSAGIKETLPFGLVNSGMILGLGIGRGANGQFVLILPSGSGERYVVVLDSGISGIHTAGESSGEYVVSFTTGIGGVSGLSDTTGQYVTSFSSGFSGEYTVVFDSGITTINAATGGSGYYTVNFSGQPTPVSDVSGTYSTSYISGLQQVPTSGYAGMPKAGYSIPGFKEVGKISSNFSCFTPIFTQDPIDAICKIGQAPTFRVEAVDYHSIPEDKMKNARYSEINYWTSRLKLTDKNKKNLYPLNYKWYRVNKQNGDEIQKTKAFELIHPITGYRLSISDIPWKPNGTHQAAQRASVIDVVEPGAWKKDNPKKYISPNYTVLYGVSTAEEASITGNWDCLEGKNSKECTVCHPKESVYHNGTQFVTGITTNPLENNSFIKGAKEGADENYYYFCVVSGRFGHRMSEIATLSLEKFATFDMSMLYGLNTPAANITTLKEGYLPTISNQGVITASKHTVQFTSANMTSKIINGYPYVPFSNTEMNKWGILRPFFGFIKDKNIINEQVIEENINMSNNCISYAFNGPERWRGFLRSYTPSTQAAVNGVAAKRSHWKDYGPLITLSRNVLTQQDGDLLYGVKALPTCVNYQMHDLNRGVTSATYLGNSHGNQFVAVRHKNVEQKAFVTNNSRVGLRSFQYEGIPQLYPPGTAGIRTGGGTNSVGIWQFHNNIGAIKRFGVDNQVPDVDITVDTSMAFPVNGGTTDEAVIAQDAFKRLFSGSSLGGACGYHANAVGANLLYFIENFQRFYISCPAKGGIKGKVRNFSYTAPGLRFGTSIVQYNWLGKPSSTYLKRKTKAGPYAYEWKVIRHNRDRRGNGWSEGFWSSFWEKKMYLYDQAAVYGLYRTSSDPDPAYQARVKEVLSLRGVAQGTIKPAGLIQNLVNFITNTPHTPQQLNFVRIGPARGPKNSCGSMRKACSAVGANGNDDTDPVCDWLDVALHLGAPPGKNYGCSRESLDAGECFDPCLSLKYTQGFYPGGKLLALTAGFRQPGSRTTTQLVSEEAYKDFIFVSELGSFNTPSLGVGERVDVAGGRQIVAKKILRGPKKSISPCKDGGADHCNYLTPVLNIGESSLLVGRGNPTTDLRMLFGGQTILNFDLQGQPVIPINVT